MAVILNIETSTRVCSVALAIDGVMKTIEESEVKNAHAESITLFSQEVTRRAGITFNDLDAVAVSMGPGSYTGLRIGVSTAKGFCYAKDLPLIAINTLEAMAYGMKKQVGRDGSVLLCPMIDARRMEVYTAVYDQNMKTLMKTNAKIVDENSFAEWMQNNKILFAGDGASKCEAVLGQNENAMFLDGFEASSAFMCKPAEDHYNNRKFVNVAYFEPFYLKDFVAGKPKVKGLY